MTLSKHDLADLDAGWDEPEADPGPPLATPSSTPPELGDLDDGWDETPAPAAAIVSPKPQAFKRPSSTKVTAPTPAATRRTKAPRVPEATVQGQGKLPLSKRERRKLEKRQRIHAAKLQAARKEKRKKARREEAKRRSEEYSKALGKSAASSGGKRRTRNKKPRSDHASSAAQPKERTRQKPVSRQDPHTPSSASQHRAPVGGPRIESEPKVRQPRTWLMGSTPYLVGLALLAALVAWWLLR